MSTNYQRDIQVQPLSANSQCRPLSPSFRFCLLDIAVIVGAIVFILYIVWGLSLTIRLCKYVRARFTAWRQRGRVMPQDLERNFRRDAPSDGPVSSSSTLDPAHERKAGQVPLPTCLLLDEKFTSALDQRRMNNFRFPISDSWVSVSRSVATVPAQECYSPPSTPVLGNLESTSTPIVGNLESTSTPVPGNLESTSSLNSSLPTLPGTYRVESKFEAVDAQSQVPAPLLPVYMDHSFGKSQAVCKPCMW